jgi:integrase
VACNSLQDKELESEGTNPAPNKHLRVTKNVTIFGEGVVMARSSFLLFKRPAVRILSKKIYYLKIWLPKERRYTVPKSVAVLAEKLGIDPGAWPPSTKAGAKHIAEEWMKIRGGVSRANNPLLWEYCLEFWDWDKSEYVGGKLERGQRIGKHHCHDSYHRIEEHVKKRIPGLYLQETTAEDLDRLQLRLKKETGLSEKTVNMVMAAIITPVKEAYRKGKIQRDPAGNFRNLSENAKKRGILSPAESKGIFSTPWESERGRLAALTAYSTGARLGEVLALSPEDITFDFEKKPVLMIRKSWSRYVGIKTTKTGNEKVVPISPKLRDDLIRLAGENPHKDGFIFWGTESGQPITHRIIELAFCRQLHKIGIDETKRTNRNISFHSLRHNLNAALRGKINDATLRLIMGHADPKSTDTYDHLTDKRLSEARKSIEKNLFTTVGIGA